MESRNHGFWHSYTCPPLNLDGQRHSLERIQAEIKIYVHVLCYGDFLIVSDLIQYVDDEFYRIE
ncbi:MAG: hypothetical protein OMOMHJEC_03290 [Xanthomonadales bacterium]|nr:hypothetical protein [Xanthomonadales bacterium]